jgi:DNA-binding beta-propeller fold protein YncE
MNMIMRIVRLIDSLVSRRAVAGLGLVSALYMAAACSTVTASTKVSDQAEKSPVAPYKFITPILGNGADGLWDLISVGAASRRLYLAQDGVTILDLDSGKVTPGFAKIEAFRGVISTHHALEVNNGKVLAVTDIVKNSVDFYDLESGNKLSSVTLGPPPQDDWHDPDVLIHEPITDLLVTINPDVGTLSLIDTKSFTKVGMISIGKGELEAGIADGSGVLYVNEAEAGAIAVVDVAKREVVRTIPMNGCKDPTGMAYDAEDGLLISVCANGLAKFVDAKSGEEIASVKVGVGADGIVYDPVRRFAFSFGGDDATLSIIAVKNRQDIALAQTLATQPGARLGALDPKTGRVYIPSASFGPAAKPIDLPGIGVIPGMIPGSFEFLVVAPNTP